MILWLLLCCVLNENCTFNFKIFKDAIYILYLCITDWNIEDTRIEDVVMNIYSVFIYIHILYIFRCVFIYFFTRVNSGEFLPVYKLKII